MSARTAPWPTTDETMERRRAFKQNLPALKDRVATDGEDALGELDFVAFTWLGALCAAALLPWSEPADKEAEAGYAGEFARAGVLVDGAVASLLSGKGSVASALVFMRQGAMEAYVATRMAGDLEEISTGGGEVRQSRA